MSNTLKLKCIIVCLLMLVNTNFSYSSNFENNNFNYQMPVVSHPNNLEQYNNFFQQKINQLKDIEMKIPDIFNDEDETIKNRVQGY